jgi:hypothetical protein
MCEQGSGNHDIAFFQLSCSGVQGLNLLLHQMGFVFGLLIS